MPPQEQQPNPRDQPNPEREARKSFVEGLLTNFVFSLSQGLQAAAAAPRGANRGAAALGGSLAGPFVLQQQQQEQQALEAERASQAAFRTSQITTQGLDRDVIRRNAMLEQIAQQPQGASVGIPPEEFTQFPDWLQQALGPQPAGYEGSGVVIPPLPLETDPGLPSIGVGPSKFRPPRVVTQLPEAAQQVIQQALVARETEQAATRAGAIRTAEERASDPFTPTPQEPQPTLASLAAAAAAGNEVAKEAVKIYKANPNAQLANREEVRDSGTFLVGFNKATGEVLWERKIAVPTTEQLASSEYLEERTRRAIQAVDALLPQVSGWTVGWGAALAFAPESLARDFRTELDFLKAGIAFNELTAMRNASRTGGALGQVSNIELNLLESSLGGLDPYQSPENMTEQLNQVKASLQRWQDAVRGLVVELNGELFRFSTKAEADAFKQSEGIQ